ncbi:MAG: Cytochrome c oxidase (B(O/a)3-type) chain II [Hydrogenibacillus schlegelii]|uniref:Cytochrome aa3 subunit 2 n=1 Tax=Hydrogenibacillus schlegelii TaxID=1484 RepID=A0A2T5GFC8_HYDSH|nr:cytochrome c oxidase subunit II [Hydrogenibacillus schlegelii]PTQ54875.1 MAG: Cytochrome c oxidase (B(O/a)3-type) chain II [Hydrogenibacillus schlegelii]
MFRLDWPKLEALWMKVSLGTMATFLVTIGVMAFGMDVHTADGRQTIDPTRVDETPPFDRPGLYRIGPDAYRAVVVARVFTFNPDHLVLPAGARIEFVMTSADVIHGVSIPGTNVNLMLIPGQVTTYTTTFKRPGEYLLLCNEYCGIGHHLMMGRWTVVAEGGESAWSASSTAPAGR